jgi:hypothetical protein
MATRHTHKGRPKHTHSLMELRAVFEVAALPFSTPLLMTAPWGDGHPVLLLPGFMGSESSLIGLELCLITLQGPVTLPTAVRTGCSNKSGPVAMWGENADHKLGRGRNATSTPTVVNGRTGLLSVTTSSAQGMAIVASGCITNWPCVRQRMRADAGASSFSPHPILLSVDRLDGS